MENRVFGLLVEHTEFEREFKKLEKRFPTLEGDFTTFINAQLNSFHKLNIDNRGIIRLSKLGFDNPRIFKARKFACRALKGRGAKSGIRIIYAFFEETDKIEFIEIYFKGDKNRENRDRIAQYYLV